CTPTSTGGGGGATGGGGGATGGGGGTTGGGTGVTGIAGVRDLIDQNADITVARPTITGAVVSAFKPAISGASNNDPVGFFLQSVQAGPAIFVAVDPATIPNLAVGNLIDLTVETANKLNSIRVVRTISNTTRSTTTPNPVPGLAASVNNVDFSVGSTLDTWESRLVTFSATVASDPATAGAAFKVVTIGTAGTPGSSGAMRLRMPATELDALQIGVGCTLQVTTGVPMWRFNGTAQPAPSLASEVQVMSCPGPRVVIAGATSASSVVVSFDRDLLGSSITTGAFTVATVGGTPLQVTGATLSSARTVTLTTATQASGTTYRVTVGTSVLSARGDAVTTSGNTATFAGATFSSCAPQVIISQVFTQNSSTWSQDYIELHNRGATAANLTGWSIQYQSAAGSTWSVSALNTILQPGGYYLVAMGGASTTGATLAPDTTGNLSFSGAAGKVALVSSTTPMTSGCPTGSWVDLVSYGSNSTFCAEGSSAPTPNPSTTLARTDGVGCGDLNDNSVDFVAGSATPRSSSSTPVLCSCP
ncbi:MAG TPA: lamin tail domain-containing protein, partial [Archangium sp.]